MNTEKRGHVSSKSRSVGSNLEKAYVYSKERVFDLILMKLCKMFASMKSCTCLKMGHVG